MKNLFYFILFVLFISCSETTSTDDEKINHDDEVELRTYTIDTLALYKELLDYKVYDLFDLSVTSLNKYDFNGNLIEKFPYNRNTYWISIYDDIIYGNSCLHCDDSSFILTRYDLKTKQFLRDISHPAQFGYGTFIFEDTFYFVDTENWFIGSVPLNELLD